MFALTSYLAARCLCENLVSDNKVPWILGKQPYIDCEHLTRSTIVVVRSVSVLVVVTCTFSTFLDGVS